MITTGRAMALLLAALAPAAAHAAPPADAVVERGGGNQLAISWTSPDPVDDRADADPAKALLVSASDRDGRHVLADAKAPRSYIILRDARTGEMTHVAERLLPLEAGSNFRDIGGYQTVDGKRVRWGRIYRSGGTPLLTPGDLERVHALGLANMVDLRSDEERVMAPSRIDGVPYAAVGYSMTSMMKFMGETGNGSSLYRRFPEFLAPQLRLIFAMLKRNEGPIAYNCSAGQDRTGFATAVILSTLGVPRETILKDYHLSTKYRRPVNEMPRIDAALYASNPAATYFTRFQNPPAPPQPLFDKDGTPYLAGAFAEIDARWGSVDGYLKQEIGLTDADLASIRSNFLE